MSSRFLVGVGAWLLGAVTATTGSMIAVNQLAHNLLGPQTQVLGAAVGTDQDGGADSLQPSPATGAGTSSTSHRAVPVTQPNSLGTAARATAAQSQAGTFLESSDGSVTATCQSAGVYLLYWSPSQGFQADDVHRGPAAVASVTFRGPANSVVMRVSCSAGTPVAHLSQASGGDGGDGSDGGGD